MDLSKLVSSLKNELKYEYNLLTKVGPVYKSLGNDRTIYNVRLEFSGLENQFSLPNPLTCYTVDVDFAILPVIVVGNVWCKNQIIQNPGLERESHSFSFNFDDSGENNIYAKAIHEEFLLDTKEKKWAKANLPAAEFPLTYSMLFSRCFTLKANKPNKDYDVVLIPAYELLRFTFFCTSDLVSMVFNSTLKNHCETAELVSENEHRETVVIATDRNYNEKEMKVFANIFSCTDIRKTYEGMWKYLNTVLGFGGLKRKNLLESNKERAEISTSFPRCHRDLHVCGIPLLYNNTRYFYVYQIYSSAFKPNFNEIIAVSTGIAGSKLGQDNSDGKKPKKVLKVSTPNEDIEFNNKSAADAQSAQNMLEFDIDTIDVFGYNQALKDVEVDRVFDRKIRKNHVILIHTQSETYTINTERSNESKRALARIFANNRDGEREDSFRPKLLKALGRLYPLIYRKFYDYDRKDFFYDVNGVSYPDKEDKNVTVLVVKIFKNGKEKVLMDFSGIYNLRIVSFYRADLRTVSSEKIDDFIKMVVDEKRIPSYKEYIRYNVDKNKYEEYSWDRLNVGTIDENSLTDKILELLPSANQK